MSENIASLDLVKKLARAVLTAQESEADAAEAKQQAETALADLRSQVELDEEATDLIARALGNAVHAPAVDAPAIDVPVVDEEETTEIDVEADDTAVTEESSLGDETVNEDEVKPMPPSES